MIAINVTLLAPTGMALNAMLDTCTRFADSHNFLFNSSKTKCMFFIWVYFIYCAYTLIFVCINVLNLYVFYEANTDDY